MRTINWTSAFKKDYKREMKGQYGKVLVNELASIVGALANDESLSVRHRDHALVGNWKDFRDCHIRPDLILIYRKPDGENLDLVRLGSHSELGL